MLGLFAVSLFRSEVGVILGTVLPTPFVRIWSKITAASKAKLKYWVNYGLHLDSMLQVMARATACGLSSVCHTLRAVFALRHVSQRPSKGVFFHLHQYQSRQRWEVDCQQKFLPRRVGSHPQVCNILDTNTIMMWSVQRCWSADL